MIKQSFTWLMMTLVIVVGFSGIQADTTKMPMDNAFFADQLPAGADIYLAFRIDEAYITQLDDIINRVRTEVITILPEANLPEMNLSQSLDMAVQSLGIEGDFQTAIRPWLGDKLAFAVYTNGANQDTGLVIIEHKNRELTEAFIENETLGILTTSVQDDFTIYTIRDSVAKVAINDSALYISSNSDFIPFVNAPSDALANDPKFQKVVNALPLDAYNIIMIAETTQLIGLDGQTNPNNQVIQALFSGDYTVIGATIIDGVSLTLDLAQVGITSDVIRYLNEPLNSEMTRYIPGNATGVIHATNLLPLFNDIIRTTSQLSGDNLQAVVNQINTLLGVSAPELLLSGDVVLYITYKPDGTTALINTTLANLATKDITQLDIAQLFDIGVIVSHNNPDEAQTLINNLFMLSQMMPNTPEQFMATREQINGTEAIVLRLGGDTGTIPIEMVMSATDSIIVIGTRASVTSILTDESRFSTNTFYQTSLRYSLPDMTHYWFLDRNSVMFGMDMLQLLIMPSIEEAFYQMSLMRDPPTSQDESLEDMRFEITRRAYQTALDNRPQVEALAQIFNNATISIHTNEDTLFVRAVITLSE